MDEKTLQTLKSGLNILESGTKCIQSNMEHMKSLIEEINSTMALLDVQVASADRVLSGFVPVAELLKTLLNDTAESTQNEN